MADARAQGFSPKSLEDRAGTLRRFCWWLEHIEQVSPTLDAVAGDVVRRFLTYCREPNPDGRFGCQHRNARTKARPSTVATYYRDLKTFLGFCLQEQLLDAHPMRNVKCPRVPNDQIQPFSEVQVQALVSAAGQTAAPDRNRAILLTLVDTGLRVSELCSLTVRDADHFQGELSVVGKGGKRRTTYLGTAARRALKRYVTRFRATAGDEESLFTSEGGKLIGCGLTRHGVQGIVRQCGQLAQLEGVRCSPHTLRHTFAVSFLRGGGNLFELQRLMGHSDLTILRRYVALAESDLARAHRQASPADRMGLR